ncbi:type 4 prepilin-like proteins leader peptide-processing enzyme [Oceanisphaera marina]|uniref:Prepilin leader peptidase/N-methyltransferase n=1 Tax=Oceanisphaera marina TaxID=2017550 RepID=A0ABQ1IE38_9GAMM|nr:A24 family peptidase [Oceanisphaera marina]GGB36972.1 type 4 prepilin-like proteins leader peptide-processing enzyme [Oceanisphaera marina]
MATLSQWLTTNQVSLYVIVILLGLLIGSFLNVVIHRLPLMLQREWQQECAELNGASTATEPTFNLCTPRSRCPHCQQQLSALDNIPLLSWLFLRGRCRYCKAGISKRYPLIELSAAALSAFAIWRFGASPQLLAALIFSWALLCMTMIDIDHLLLPDNLTLPLLWLGLLLNIDTLFVSLQDAVLGAAIGYGVLWSLYWVFKLATGKEGMGYGDFKLLAALGAWFGWQAVLPILLLSSVAGSILGLSLMASKRLSAERALPFGPALALAGWIYLIWGQQLTSWYWSVAL